MGLTFVNLAAGLWALLGIPVILLIHFLQKERREVVTSTLFLLENLQRESKHGIRFDRLRNSLPLWLQILAVLLLAWLLSEPRWIRPDSFQRIVVVLDSSASMTPFRDDVIGTLDRRLSRTARTSARTDWILLETDPRRGTLYSGDDLDAMRAAMENWIPRSGSHDPIPAINRARSLLRRDGDVIFASDRPLPDLPSGVHLLAAGSPIENCGFAGLSIEDEGDRTTWRALVRNYGNHPQTREWRAVFGEHATSPQTIRLDPGQTVALSGEFPPDADEGFLTMTPDRFSLDDWLPLLRPRPKEISISVEEHPALDGFTGPFLRSLPHWRPVASGRPDLRLATRLPGQNDLPHPAVYFLTETTPPERLLSGPILAENHPLTRDLNWDGLLVQTGSDVSVGPDDRVLLWQGDRPLILLRQSGSSRSLFCNFDLRYSNAARLPAFVVLLHRFTDQIRETKIDFEQRMLETNQTFALAADPLGGDLTFRFRDRSNNLTEQTIPAHRAPLLTAPGDPGFLEIHQNNRPLLRAAVHFADTREADFRAAATEDNIAASTAARLQRNTTADFLTPLWLLLLATTLLVSWRLTSPHTS